MGRLAFWALLFLAVFAAQACDPIVIDTRRPTDTPEPTATIEPPTATPDPKVADCARLNLTPEECANLGTHTYAIESTATFVGPSTSCEEGSYSETVAFEFSVDGSGSATWRWGQSDHALARTGTNSYSGSWLQPDGRYEFVHLITFEKSGFVDENKAVRIPESTDTCIWVDTYTLSDGAGANETIDAPEENSLSGGTDLLTPAAARQPTFTEAVRASPRAPGAAEPDIGFRFESGVCFTDVLDTFQGTFTKDLINAQPVTIPLSLSSQQMQAVYDKMLAIDFFDYPAVFAIPKPSSGLMTVRTSATKYRMVVTSGGTTKTLDWVDEIVQPTNQQAENLRSLFKIIEEMIASSPAYQQLPERSGGCA